MADEADAPESQGEARAADIAAEAEAEVVFQATQAPAAITTPDEGAAPVDIPAEPAVEVVVEAAVIAALVPEDPPITDVVASTRVWNEIMGRWDEFNVGGQLLNPRRYPPNPE